MFTAPFVPGLVLAALVSSALAADRPQPSVPPAAPIPEGYSLVYETHFDSPAAAQDWVFSDPEAWTASDDGSSRAPELTHHFNFSSSASVQESSRVAFSARIVVTASGRTGSAV